MWVCDEFSTIQRDLGHGGDRAGVFRIRIDL